VRNQASRYHLVIDAINNSKRAPRGAAELKLWCQRQLTRHAEYIDAHLEDLPEVRDWIRQDPGSESTGAPRTV
jgi:xylulose-5-phosphate/fructose-6-phosphate phosphoketolase